MVASGILPGRGMEDGRAGCTLASALLATLRWAKIRFGGGTDWRLAQFIGARDIYIAGLPGVDIGVDAIMLHSSICGSPRTPRSSR